MHTRTHGHCTVAAFEPVSYVFVFGNRSFVSATFLLASFLQASEEN